MINNILSLYIEKHRKQKKVPKELYFFSAAQLVKYSAMRIIFLSKNPNEKIISDRMIEGQKEADKNTIGLKEMSSFYQRENYRIYYSVDEIRIKKGKFVFIEHKMVSDQSNYEQWYFESSILQCAFYLAMHNIKKDRIYKTSKFEYQATGNKIHINLNNTKIRYILYFGKDKYEIKVSNSQKVIDYYFKKVKECSSYESAKIYDSVYKYNDFIHLKKYIKYIKL